MLSVEDHLDNLVRHIRLVQDACLLMGKRLIAKGRTAFGRNLIAAGFQHDVSKFEGMEWKYLHAGRDVPPEKLKETIEQHQETNFHHPEHWGGVSEMPDLYVAEMVCDWYARSQEFGTGLRDWIDEEGVKRYNIDPDGPEYKLIMSFVDVLLENHFAKTTEEAA